MKRKIFIWYLIKRNFVFAIHMIIHFVFAWTACELMIA